MRLESKKFLFDIQQAARRIAEFVGNKDLSVARISEYTRIIAFRNILVHGYADIDDRIVWGIVESNLPALLQEVESLLK